ncbi:hypothetical protein V495_03964 [Pseudogymnoascus sp. VKM F-4514 (FW-929)]|nr:hypothetical protein V495_03964 [Pseudogymnoascus sp. VKM F-4514 (FW-929)]KFY58660.1 hypothetical protein V497_04721 [Pseudogymnoascus sp. VKM F-4516 (FW-969)]
MSNLPPNYEPADELPAVFIGPDGTIEYPSLIPPHVEFPATTPRGTHIQRPASAEVPAEGGLGVNEPFPDQRPRGISAPITSHPHKPSNQAAGKVGGTGPGAPENPLGSTPPPSTYLNHRPSPVKGWRTELPEPARKSRAPNGRRATEGSGPNGSAVAYTANGANAVDSADTSDTSSSSPSSSESSDEDDEPQGVLTKPLSWVGRGRKRADSDPKKPNGPRRSSTSAKARSRYRKFNLGNDKYKSSGKVSKNDGRLKISVSDTSNTGYLAKALGATFRRHLGHIQEGTPSRPSSSGTDLSSRHRPLATCSDWTYLKKQKKLSLNVVIMVIGSRGDIQPFLKLGKVLKENHGHRVRIATHPAFRDFVEHDSGLEFFSVGGDPAELMAFMVKNPGMIPTMETLKKGEVGRRRAAMAEMFEGFWRACINATDDEHDVQNLKMMGTRGPFIADAIIANPPSFAHIHCAERLGIPLHLMFTFPYTPTLAFPHPLANIKKTNVDPGYTNFMSYPLVEMMTWQGLGDLVNDFRVKTLGLEPVSTLWAPGQLYRLRVPYTYLWSPGLVPKPNDWGPEIDIAGFVFLDLASTFEPPEELTKFLDDGEPPIYIGFGSIVVDDPNKFTQMIYEATEIAGVRALVSKGWGGFGGDDSPENVFMLENTPHDWLFPKLKAVVHHGGAGTTAISLKCGKPTLVVPFFGDQFFWGNMIGKSGAGAEPIPYKELTAEKLAEGIKVLLEDKTQEKAEEIAKSIEEEGDGADNAIKTFQRGLAIRNEQSMRCSVLDDRLAVWTLKKTNLRLSALAADFLVGSKKIRWKQLRLLRRVEWNDFEGPGEPVTGIASTIAGNFTSAAAGVGSIPFRLAQSAKRRKHHEEKKARKERKAIAKEKRKQMKSAPVQNGAAFAPGNSNGGAGQPQSQVTDPLEATVARRDLLPSNQVPNVVASTQGNHAAEQIQGGRPDESQAGGDQSLADDDSALTVENPHGCADEIAEDITGGLRKSGRAIITTPIDLSTAVAQGFHNAPRLYGDETVRRPTRITGIHSGLKAAGKEFVFGIYDGWTGLVMQPYDGAVRDGPIGFVKGIGMGVTGFALKTLAAVIGPFAYTAKGAQKELHKGQQPTQFLRRARIIQGQRDLVSLSDAERAVESKKVAHGWAVMEELWREMAEERRDGLFGHIKAVRERKTWRMEVRFDNVYMAEKALEALHRGDGECLETIFEHQRRQMEEERMFTRTAARRDKDVRMDRAIRARRVTEFLAKEENELGAGGLGGVGPVSERPRGYSDGDMEPSRNPRETIERVNTRPV